jgi:hypothetical protein
MFGGEGWDIYEKSNKHSIIEVSAGIQFSEGECPTSPQQL